MLEKKGLGNASAFHFPAEKIDLRQRDAIDLRPHFRTLMRTHDTTPVMILIFISPGHL
jgi:hypothetical protein